MAMELEEAPIELDADVYQVEYFAPEDDVKVSWIDVAGEDDRPLYMWNDNPLHEVRPHQIIRIGQVHQRDTAWELAPYKDTFGQTVNPVVDLDSSMFGVLQYYRYESEDDAADWQNRGWPDHEPHNFIVYTNPETLSELLPTWTVVESAGSARDWSPEARGVFTGENYWNPTMSDEHLPGR